MLAKGVATVAAHRSASAVALLGEAGIGKTRLCHDAEHLAREHDVTVFAGRAIERSSAAPYHALAEALSRGVGMAGPPADAAVHQVRSTLGHLVPAWFPPGLDQPNVVGVAEAVLRVLHAVARRSGVLLILEDLHWADAETLAVTEYVAAALRDSAVFVVVTLRPDESVETTQMARRLGDTRVADVIDLHALDDAAMHALVLDCLGQDAAPDDLVAWVVGRADGNPFLAEELLAGLARTGALVATTTGWRTAGSRMTATVPATLAESVKRRYRSLAPRSQQVLSAAALMGPRFEWRHLAPVTGLDEAAVMASLHEANDAGLLVADGDGLRFRHALTCDEVRELTLPPQRADLAARIADIVAEAGPADSADQRDTLAGLALVAGQYHRAAANLLAAAEHARRRGALASAATRLESAHALVPDVGTALGLRIRQQLATVYALSGNVDAAFDWARSVHADAADPADPAEPADGRLLIGGSATQIELASTLARAALAAGRYDDAMTQVRAARDGAVAVGDDARTTAADALTAEIHVAAGHPETAAALAESVLDRAGDDLPEVRCAAHEVLGRCQRLRDVRVAEASFDAARRIAEAHGLLAWRARALHELGTIDLFDSLRVDRLTDARRAAVEAGVPATEAVVDLHLAAALLSRGDTADGRAVAERCVELSTRMGLATRIPALIMVARGWAQQRRPDRMAAILREVDAEAPGDAAAHAGAWSHARTMLALHEADRDGALDALDHASEWLARAPGEHDPHRGLWALLRTLADRDARAARAEAAAAPGSGTRFNTALLTAAEAVELGREGQCDAATRRADEALLILGGYESATWLTHLTTWLLSPAAVGAAWGEPTAWLTRSVRWFDGHGYEPLATSCRVLLRAAGGVVPRRGRGDSDVPPALARIGVSNRECDVLRLLPARRTNRQIADRLVISPRTVEKHVASLLLKTGRADRNALRDLAHDLGFGLDLDERR